MAYPKDHFTCTPRPIRHHKPSLKPTNMVTKTAARFRRQERICWDPTNLHPDVTRSKTLKESSAIARAHSPTKKLEQEVQKDWARWHLSTRQQAWFYGHAKVYNVLLRLACMHTAEAEAAERTLSEAYSHALERAKLQSKNDKISRAEQANSADHDKYCVRHNRCMDWLAVITAKDLSQRLDALARKRGMEESADGLFVPETGSVCQIRLEKQKAQTVMN